MSSFRSNIMNISSISLGKLNLHDASYKIDLFISDLEDSLEPNEQIGCVISYATNIYIGTSLGRVMHYHQFPDYPNFMLISQIEVRNEPNLVTKMLVLRGIERILILAGNTVSIYTLPELSPCNIGKLKSINDLLHLETSLNISKDLMSSIMNNEKIIAFSPSKIRILQINKDLIKMLKEINYPNAITGVSASSSTSPNYSNIGLIANKRNYIIVDFKETKQLSLFDYCPTELDQNSPYKPNIIPFKANDRNGSEEYLLTICSDERTSIGMFIDSAGNVTRGTLTWLDLGIPSHGLVIEWPYTLGVFEKEKKHRLVISSLIDLSIKYVQEINILPKKNEDTTQDIESKNVKEGDANQEVSQEDKTKDQEPKADVPSEYHNFNICRISEVKILSDKLVDLFKLKNCEGINNDEENLNVFESGSIILYDKSKIWLLHEEDELIKCQSLASSYFEGESDIPILDLLRKLESSQHGERLTYVSQLLFLVLIHQNKFNEAINVALKTEQDNLIIHPLFVLYLCAKSILLDSLTKDIKIFSGLINFVNQIKLSNYKQIIKEYLVRLFPIYTVKEKEDNYTKFIRNITYELLESYDSLVSLIDSDSEFWKVSNESRKSLLNELEKLQKFYSLVYIYQIILESSSEKEFYGEKICDLCFSILRGEVKSKESDTEENINLTGIIINQLSNNFKSANIYAKYLLEFINFDSNLGINFMKSNKKKEFTAAHKSIMDELSKSYKGEQKLNLLRIEYLEYLMHEEPNNKRFLEELLDELLKEMDSKHMNNEEVRNNFGILMKTYCIDNSLSNDTWPKVSWLDYLIVNKENSECQDYIELYLKILELLIYITYQVPEVKINWEFKEEPLYDYFSIIISTSSQITKLMEASDYSTAEYVAIYGTLPEPSKLYYQFPKKNSQCLDPADIHENLKMIFQLYTKTEFEVIERNLAIKHFVDTFATNYFLPVEILTMIPDYVPLIYIQKYLMKIIINSNADNKGIIMMKALNKADASFSKSLIKDLS